MTSCDMLKTQPIVIFGYLFLVLVMQYINYCPPDNKVGYLLPPLIKRVSIRSVEALFLIHLRRRFQRVDSLLFHKNVAEAGSPLSDPVT